jgi:hypothetical protein
MLATADIRWQVACPGTLSTASFAQQARSSSCVLKKTAHRMPSYKSAAIMHTPGVPSRV